MIEPYTITHQHQDGRWVKEHVDQLGSIEYTSNFDHEAMLRDHRLWEILGCSEIKHWGNLDRYYKRYPELYRSEIIYLYQQWRDFVQEGYTMAGFKEWLEYEINDDDSNLNNQRDEARDEAEATLYDNINECLELADFN